MICQNPMTLKSALRWRPHAEDSSCGKPNPRWRTALLLVGCAGLALPAASLSRAQQTDDPPAAEAPEGSEPSEDVPPGPIELEGADAEHATALEQAVETALENDDWDGAIELQVDLVELRRRIQGAEHFEAEDTNAEEPTEPPDHGLLVNLVVAESNAAQTVVQPGDVLLSYNGQELTSVEDLQTVAQNDKPIPIELWRDGLIISAQVQPGKLGVAVDPRPAPEAIEAERQFEKLLLATRSGGWSFPPLPGTRYEVESLAHMFKAQNRPLLMLFQDEASEPRIDELAQNDRLREFGYIHLATHGVVDLEESRRTAVILTQTGLPDPVDQLAQGKPPYDGRLSVSEIQRRWQLNAGLVTLSACQTALGRQLGGEGLVGFTQALLMSGAQGVCLSLWEVEDTATALLMQRFYQNLLGTRDELTAPMPKAEALAEAKRWLRNLRRTEAIELASELSSSLSRGVVAEGRAPSDVPNPAVPEGAKDDRPYDHPYFWAAFILAGDPN